MSRLKFFFQKKNKILFETGDSSYLTYQRLLAGDHNARGDKQQVD